MPGVDSFVPEPLPGCYEEEMVVSFPTATPFLMKRKNALVDLKQAELEHEVRLLVDTASVREAAGDVQATDGGRVLERESERRHKASF